MDDRLQQNWKIKRHRLVAAASGNEGFYIDLFDSALYDLASVFRPSPMSTIPVEHDAAGMLTVNIPRKSCHSLQFEFLGLNPAYKLRKSGETKTQAALSDSSLRPVKEHATDEERVREMHLTLREVHRAIHDEQVYLDLCISHYILLSIYAKNYNFISFYINSLIELMYFRCLIW